MTNSTYPPSDQPRKGNHEDTPGYAHRRSVAGVGLFATSLIAMSGTAVAKSSARPSCSVQADDNWPSWVAGRPPASIRSRPHTSTCGTTVTAGTSGPRTARRTSAPSASALYRRDLRQGARSGTSRRATSSKYRTVATTSRSCSRTTDTSMASTSARIARAVDLVRLPSRTVRRSCEQDRDRHGGVHAGERSVHDLPVVTRDDSESDPPRGREPSANLGSRPATRCGATSDNGDRRTNGPGRPVCR